MRIQYQGVAMNKVVFFLVWTALFLILSLGDVWAAEDVKDHRVEMKIDETVEILKPGSVSWAMMSLARHPDGTILLHTQNVLFKSDDGRTWMKVPVEFKEVPPQQIHLGMGVTRSGRILLAHQTEDSQQSFYISFSDDGGQTWTKSPTDFGKIPPGVPHMRFHEFGGRTFIEQPDGTLMFTTTIVPVQNYKKKHAASKPYAPPNYQYGGTPLDYFSDIVLRSYDGGETWGDPTRVYPQLNPHESALAIGPCDPNRILLMTRIQSSPKWYGEERQKEIMRETGNPKPFYKNGALFASMDGGRTFDLAPGGMTPWYGHRGTINWFDSNVVVVTHHIGGDGVTTKVARISLNGGKTWVDGTQAGTTKMNESKEFLVHPSTSYSSPTIELANNQFMTTFFRHPDETIGAVFWHLEPTETYDQSTVLEIGHDKQLFLDDYVIESLNGAVKRLNQPVKFPGNPVLARVPQGDPGWDADRTISFCSTLYDEEEKLFKMWYSLHETGQLDEHAVLAYATSRNGIIWDKPELGIHTFRGKSDNNIVIDHHALESGVFKDPHDPDPAKRYKVLFRGISAAYSADGLQWHDYNEGRKVIFHFPGHDSQSAPYWDDQLGKYVAIIRNRTGMIKDVRPELVSDEVGRAGHMKLWLRRPEIKTLRRVGQVESVDFVNWTLMRTVVAADADDPLNRDQFYHMSVMLYEGLRVGLMTVFSYDPDYCRGAVQLTYSRDGMAWHRAGNRAVFLPNSKRAGDIDWGSIYTHHAPMVVGDEIWIYYSGFNVDHHYTLPPGATQFRNGICLAKLRLDGFVSVDYGATDQRSSEMDERLEGTLTTKPFTFCGGKLVINADAHSGYILAELLDAGGKPMGGFAKQDCDALRADVIHHPVAWQGKTDVTSLEGKVVKLKFYIRGAKLFSFRFEN